MKDLRPRIVDRLQAAGAEGLTKTALTRLIQPDSGDQLNLALQQLLNSFTILTSAAPTKPRLGRPARRFWHRDFADGVPEDQRLTLPVGDATIVEPGEPPPAGGVCRRCGRATPIVLDDKPLAFCSDECRENALPTRADLVARVSDPRIWARLASLFVVEDLIVRGFEVAIDLFDARAGRVFVHDANSSIWLSVIPMPQSGHLPALDEYESVAIVFRDGRIQYGGKNPLVAEPGKDDNDGHGSDSSGVPT